MRDDALAGAHPWLLLASEYHLLAGQSRQLTYSIRVGIRPGRKLSGDKSAEL
jgi:hypothetical protein